MAIVGQEEAKEVAQPRSQAPLRPLPCATLYHRLRRLKVSLQNHEPAAVAAAVGMQFFDLAQVGAFQFLFTTRKSQPKRSHTARRLVLRPLGQFGDVVDDSHQGAAQRADALAADEGVWGCTFVGECSEVCPKNVDPAGAIQRAKVDSVKTWYKKLLMPWGGS